MEDQKKIGCCFNYLCNQNDGKFCKKESGCSECDARIIDLTPAELNNIDSQVKLSAVLELYQRLDEYINRSKKKTFDKTEILKAVRLVINDKFLI